MPTPLQRDIDRLGASRFDVLVIGGGIYGLTVAADAAQRGLAVALIERDDFGSGTSFNHLRTIHGGLRYLQSLDLARARESVRERRTLARIAPWAVRPLPFVLPLGRSLTRGRAALTAAFLLDRVIAGDRNDDVPESHRLPPGRVISRAAAHAAYPELERLDITGAAVWYDYLTVDADRLTFAWALSAAAHGAVLANYVEATALLNAEGCVSGALATERMTGTPLRIGASAVVNATGSAIDRLLTPFHAQTGIPLLQAINVVTRHPAPAAALGGRGRSGRNLFVVPCQGRATFGTWESPTLRPPGEVAVQETDLRKFIEELNEAFPGFGLTDDDVTLVHRGLVPARVSAGGALSLEGHELVFSHGAKGLDRLTSVAGTKYTTARAVAQRIVDRICASLGRTALECRSDVLPLPSVDLQGDDLLRHAAANEMVVTLADAVVRRTPLGAAGCPEPRALEHAATIVGETLGWATERQRTEVAEVRRLY